MSIKRVRKNGKLLFFAILVSVFIFSHTFAVLGVQSVKAFATPFYGLNPKELVLRAEFFTTYEKSTKERKHNVYLAVKSINKTLVEAGGEFSFNCTVGERTEKRGYKKAKIISDGKFVDGVGGGVCQVSTTLYNAALLSGLKITEYHPHSLSVSYVSLSRDAMVNSSYADLRFINTTENPVIIYAFCDGERITVRIVGEKMKEKYEIESNTIEIVPIPEDVVLIDETGDYTYLEDGEREIISYGKTGYKSESYLVKIVNGKKINRKRIRKDVYKSTPNVFVKSR